MGGVRGAVGNRPMRLTLPWTSRTGLEQAQKFVAQPGDVFIVSYPKTGTTMAQQLCHQLRTGGHVDFEEVSDEVPWLEVAPSLGQPIDASQRALPRCFKTHQSLSTLSHLEGARFLCLVRDPEKTLVSEFKQKLAKGSPAAAARDVNAFARQRIFLGDDREAEGEVPLQFAGTIWEYYVEMWKCRDLPEVRVFVYECLAAEMEEQVDSVAEFMGLPRPAEEVRKRALEFTSLGWMSSSSHKFDDNHIGRWWSRSHPGEECKFTHSSKVGLQMEDCNACVTSETRALLTRKWTEVVTPATGHTCYADFAAALRRNGDEARGADDVAKRGCL